MTQSIVVTDSVEGRMQIGWCTEALARKIDGVAHDGPLGPRRVNLLGQSVNQAVVVKLPFRGEIDLHDRTIIEDGKVLSAAGLAYCTTVVYHDGTPSEVYIGPVHPHVPIALREYAQFGS